VSSYTRYALRTALALPVLLLAAPELTHAQGAPQPDPDRRTITGEKVAIFNLAGRMRVEPGPGSAVVVEITRGGADADDLRINELRRGETNVLAVAFPGDRIVYPALGRRVRTMQTVNEDGTWGSGMGRRDRRVTIASDGSGTEAYADLRVLVPRGQTISLHLGVGDVNVSNVEGNIAVDVAAASITTENTRGMLLLDAGSGETTVRNQRGDLVVDAGSGAITLTDVDGSQILVDAGSGRITADRLTARSIVVDAGSGSLRLGRVDAETMSLDCGSGSVDVQVSSSLRTLDIDGGSGNVTLRVPETIGARIEAETGRGGIDVDLPMQVRRVGRDRLSATIGDGSAMVRIDSGSGRIRIVKG